MPGVDVEKEFEYSIRLSKDTIVGTSLSALHRISANLEVDESNMVRMQKKKKSVWELEGIVNRAKDMDRSTELQTRFNKRPTGGFERRATDF